MQVSDVLEIVRGLSGAGVTVWVDGGWCVDALVGRQLRDHADLDIAIDRSDETLSTGGSPPRAMRGKVLTPRRSPTSSTRALPVGR